MGQGQPVISVILPVYNVEGYVTRCLDSIAAQTYWNIEIIAVDDGSLDHSGRLCEAYAAKEKRLQVVRFPVNRGPSAARNEGVRRAQGRYICFVDADDYIEPELLQKLYENLLENGADVSACGADGLPIKDGPAAVYSQREAVRCLAKGTPFNLVPWGKLYRAELVKNCPFDERVFYSEDLLFLYQLFKQVQKLSYLPDRLYHYVCREGSQMQSGISGRKCTALMVNDWICEDATLHFPEVAEDFRQMALEVNRCLGVLAVKKGAAQGRLWDYLKQLSKNTRRHFSWRALALCPQKKDMAAILALYASAAVFWGMAAVNRYLQ